MASDEIAGVSGVFDRVVVGSARDTIAALATPAGRGGIGVVRVSGPGVERVAHVILSRVPRPRVATYSVFCDAHGDAIDEGIALYFEAPNSYTGESVLELQGHGGPVLMRSLLSACLDAGARLAEPGEFTRRAYLAGRLDLAQAEAVADLIDAESREAARSALRSLRGEFSSAIEELAARVIELRALVEAMLDFPEEEVDGVHRDDASSRLNGIRAALSSVRATSRQGSLLRSGVQVVIVGRPNVGKSSLLNRLAGEDRAIVAATPGTTRDALRETIDIDGVPVNLVDTAGLRESHDEVEQLGIQRSWKELAKADVFLWVADATAGMDSEGEETLDRLPEATRRISVLNKADLLPVWPSPRREGEIYVSALTGVGLGELRVEILRAAGWVSGTQTVFSARERHLRAIARAQLHLDAAHGRLGEWEFFAEELRLAQVALGEITGEFTPDDLLGEIFGRFCIGK